tara:strand:- start:370 stop:969 length:600 start_codon:yes stop_codon:yes gene_type:complete
MLKLAIPYRDRDDHLKKFSIEGIKFLEECGIPYKLIIVEQAEGELFNLGKLTNIGFDLFRKEGFSEEDSYIYQPVDCIPFDVDYEAPRGGVVKLTRPDENKFYKSFSIDPEVYEKINGITNKCWGWGGEDENFFFRLDTWSITVERRAMDFEELPHGHDCQHNPNNLGKVKEIDGLDTLEYTIIEETERYGITTFVCKI